MEEGAWTKQVGLTARSPPRPPRVAQNPKLRKPAGAAATEFDGLVASELVALESNPAIKAELSALHITGAREIDTKEGKKAAVVFVPFPELAEWKKIGKTVIEELEKKLSKHHVVILAQRTILHPNASRRSATKGPRPRSRTLKAVQEAALHDLVYPAEIVGKRTKVRVDGSKVIKVHLTHKDMNSVGEKTATFSAVYKALTNKDVTFEFPSSK